MPSRVSTEIHVRGLLVVAAGAATALVALSHARADVECFAPAFPTAQHRGDTAGRPVKAPRSCADAIFSFGDKNCGAPTSGHSVDNSDGD